MGLSSGVLICSERTLKDKTNTEDRYFLSSLTVSAKRALEGVRKHWQVENKLHWVLDVAFNEDSNTTVTDHGAENLAVLRRWSLNLMRTEGSAGSIAKNRKRVGWDDDYRTCVLPQLVSPSSLPT